MGDAFLALVDALKGTMPPASVLRDPSFTALVVSAGAELQAKQADARAPSRALLSPVARSASASSLLRRHQVGRSPKPPALPLRGLPRRASLTATPPNVPSPRRPPSDKRLRMRRMSNPPRPPPNRRSLSKSSLTGGPTTPVGSVIVPRRTPQVSWTSVGAWDCEDTLVVDVGTSHVRGGRAGEDSPTVSTPSYVTSYGGRAVAAGHGPEDIKAIQRRRAGSLTLESPTRHPVAGGMITDWGDVESLFEHVFRGLRVDAKEHAVALTVPANATDGYKAGLVQFGFETLGLRGMSLVPAPACGLWGTAKQLRLAPPDSLAATSGVVIDLGLECTWASRVLHGFTQPGALTLPFGGAFITENLRRWCGISGVSVPQGHLLSGIKEAVCAAAPSAGAALGEAPLRPYRSAGGHELAFTNEPMRAVEALFSPGDAGLEAPGVVDAACGLLAGSGGGTLTLVGGTAALPGLAARVDHDTRGSVTAVCAPRPSEAVWCGAAAAANAPTTLFVSAEEYAAVGDALAAGAFVL